MSKNNTYGITILHQPSEPDDVVFDLVAIHGLNGDAFNTWTHKQSQVMWLRDLLPDTLPNVRIMTYGYNASFYNFTGHQDLRNIAMKLLSELVDVRKLDKELARPVVFICHSLGGIIAKKALLIGCSSEQAAVQAATYGIIFMATPHCGSSLANIGLVMSNIAAACSPITSPRRLLGSLQKDSKVLFEIASDFVSKLPKLRIVSFFEMETTSLGIFKRIVVDKHSAILNVPNEIIIGQYANHRSIARFSSAEDRTYRPVRCRLEQFIKDIYGAVPSNVDTETNPAKVSPAVEPDPDPLFVVPFAQCSTFKGREKLLSDMEQYFWQSQHAEQQLMYAISGLGGCGKTQTALRYAFRNRFKYKSGVLFFNASSNETLVADFSRVYDLLKLGSASNKTEALKQWFSKKKNRDWLIIFDNADDLSSVPISKYFPAASWGHIIITSRDQSAVKVIAPAGEMLEPLPAEDAISVLLSKSAIINPSVGEMKEAVEIVNLLGCLPLAIDQAGAFIRRRCKSLGDYRRLLESKRHEVFKATPNIMENEKSVASVWELNLQQIEKDAPRAWELLVMVAFLEPGEIPEILLRRGSSPKKIWNRNGEIDAFTPQDAGIKAELVHLLNDEMQFDDAIERLASFSLIQWNNTSGGRYGKALSIHPLVQHCVTHRVDPRQRQKWQAQAILLVAQAFPFSVYTDEDFGNIGRTIFPNVPRMLNEFSSVEHNHPQYPQLQDAMKLMLLSSSKFHTNAWKRKAIHNVRELLDGENDAFLNAWTASRESQLLRWAGRTAASYEALERHIHKTVLPGHDGDMDPRYNAERGELVLSYAENLIKDSEFSRAEEALKAWSPVNPDSPSTMEKYVDRSCRVTLSRILKTQGRFQEALDILEVLLHQLSDADYFASTGWQMGMFANLADVYCEIGRPRDAEAVLQTELQIIHTQGWSEISSGRRLHHALVETFIRRGMFDLAQKCLLKILPLFEADEEPDFIQSTGHFRTWVGLARIAHLQGRWTEALFRWRRAMGILEKKKWLEGFTYGITSYSMAQVLFRTGDVEESHAVLEKAKTNLALEGRRHWISGLGSYWYDYVVTDLGATGPSPIIVDSEEAVIGVEEDDLVNRLFRTGSLAGSFENIGLSPHHSLSSQPSSSS